jgi:lysophospholipase L1-like esterase
MWLKQLALLIASLLFGLLLIELALRVLGWSYPLFVQPDANLGWSFRPSLSGWSSHENTAYLRMNRYGFRGPDWTEQPGPNSLRIAVVGDSFVDSSNLADEDALTSVIEKQLAACPAFANRHAEVLNFGVSGYGTAQEYLMLQQRIAPLHPNLVLLAFYVGNDVMNNSLALSVDDQKAKPYFVELPSGELRLDTGFLDTAAFRQEVGSDWRKRLINKSYLLQVLKQIYLDRSVIPAPIDAPDRSATPAHKTYKPEAVQVFAPPADDTWRSAWNVTEKVLLRMRDWSMQQNVGFDVVIIPDPIQVLPGKDWRRANAGTANIADLDYPAKRVAQFAARNGIAYLSLLEPFQAYGDREHAFLYGFPPSLGNGHLNATGNQLGGKLIADWVCQKSSR